MGNLYGKWGRRTKQLPPSGEDLKLPCPTVTSIRSGSLAVSGNVVPGSSGLGWEGRVPFGGWVDLFQLSSKGYHTVIIPLAALFGV